VVLAFVVDLRQSVQVGRRQLSGLHGRPIQMPLQSKQRIRRCHQLGTGGLFLEEIDLNTLNKAIDVPIDSGTTLLVEPESSNEHLFESGAIQTEIQRRVSQGMGWKI
jgi:hypothetical protein